MAIIAHISDLHFGRTDPAVVEQLVTTLTGLRPRVVVVSGDLTQRARRSQFREARDFLQRLPAPRVVIPGNHDIPFYDVLRRTFWPLRRYRRFISADTEPSYVDSEIAVQGLNSARAGSFKNGRINTRQIERTCSRFHDLDQGIMRVVVTHHPLNELLVQDREEVVEGAQPALAAFAACGVDVVLSGHWHRSLSAATPLRVAPSRSLLLVQAGTATSVRRRAEPNSFNVIQVEPRTLSVRTMTWVESRGEFALAAERVFRREDWREVDGCDKTELGQLELAH